MDLSSSQSASPPSPYHQGQGLSMAGLVLILLFLTIAAGSLLPIELVDPTWQLRLGSALINASPFALIGLVLLQLATIISPGDRRLARRHQLAARVAVAVAIGYLLLIPLLSTAALRQYHNQTEAQSIRLKRAHAQLRLLREAVTAAASPSDLEQRLTALQGPKLDAANRNLPLAQLRSHVSLLLDQASAQVNRAQASAPSTNPWRLLPDVARTTIASLGLAVGFAALAFRHRSPFSLLQECQKSLQQQRLRFQVAQRRRQYFSQMHDVHQLSDKRK